MRNRPDGISTMPSREAMPAAAVKRVSSSRRIRSSPIPSPVQAPRSRRSSIGRVNRLRVHRTRGDRSHHRHSRSNAASDQWPRGRRGLARDRRWRRLATFPAQGDKPALGAASPPHPHQRVAAAAPRFQPLLPLIAQPRKATPTTPSSSRRRSRCSDTLAPTEERLINSIALPPAIHWSGWSSAGGDSGTAL